MRLLFVADGRSTTTHSWLEYWIKGGAEVHLVSTNPCQPLSGLASFHILPVIFSKFAEGGKTTSSHNYFSLFRPLIRILRYTIGPVSLQGKQRRFLKLVSSLRPDLVHALRIPFEGMLALVTPKEIPFFVSIWGNDLTLHARGSPMMGHLTRSVLRRADALFADSNRDIRMGDDWSLKPEALKYVIPGAGGIHLKEINQQSQSIILPEPIPDFPLVVNPRGQRPGSIRQDNFFRAIPKILEKIPDAFFICPALKGDAHAESWVSLLGIRERVRLWPKISQAQLWALFRKSLVYLSPSVHDGIPNSFLEALACGCFPVTGNIESMQEWINDDENGLLIDASDATDIAGAVVCALNNPALRERAAKINTALLAERADYELNMQRIKEIYTSKIFQT